METFGELIKKLREEMGWPQRKLAYDLDIDVAVLSRMENESSLPKKRMPEIIKTLADLYEVSEEELKTCYFSDEIAALLVNEGNYNNILKTSEKKLYNVRSSSVTHSDTIISDGSN